MKQPAAPPTPLLWALVVVLIVACIILAAATWHVSVAADKVTNTSLHMRDVHDSYIVAVNEQNNAAGKYHAAAAELSRINKLLEQTYGRSQR